MNKISEGLMALVDEEMVEEVVSAIGDRGLGEDRDMATVQPIQPAPEVKGLFVGPFALETQVQEKRREWEEKLSAEYQIEMTMAVAEPPFDIEDDIEAKGYWIKPKGRTLEQRVQKLRTQLCSNMITLMGYVNEVRPRVLVGLGQGAVVVAIAGFPMIVERACRDRAVTQHQFRTFREAWSGVTSLLVIDPVVFPASNNAKSVPYEVLSMAFPEMEWAQPRGNLRAVFYSRGYMTPPLQRRSEKS